MRINTDYNTEQANEDLSFILNPKETQKEKNERIKKEVLKGVFEK